MRKKIIRFRNKVLVYGLSFSMLIGLCGCGADRKEKGKDDDMITIEEVFGLTDDNEEPPVCCEDTTVEAGMNCYEEVACDTASQGVNSYNTGSYDEAEPEEFNTNEYNDLAENSWMSVETSPFSTFAADVDTASYSNIRYMIMNGNYVDPASVRIEEMINYFHYDYAEPKKDEKFGVYTEYADCPWNEDTKLVLVSLNTEDIDFADAPDSNIVFLIDTSGSMYDANKLPLVQQSLCLLAENLTEKDRVSIVTYAGSEEVILEGESGDNYYEISSAIENLEAGGSTNGSAGIETAYEIAEKYFIPGGNNRVILCTDGDLNVGVTSEGQLEKLITEKKKSGVFLSVLGFGDGNYKDNKLETLADKGNGNYAYIDTIFEARKALVDDMGASLLTVAKDVKLQVEFNPNQVKGYRLIGYENRVMAAEDFADDTKDGGEMGAGHTVTAIYEVALIDSDMEIPSVDSKYDTDESVYDDKYSDELFTLNVRYKEADEDESKLNTYVCTKDDYIKEGSDNMRWAAAVAGFGMMLKESEYMGTVDEDMIIELAESVKDYEEDEYKLEFVDMVNTYVSYN